MDLNQTKFINKTEKAAHNMALLAIVPCGMFFVWQLVMVLTGNPAGNLGGVLFWGALMFSYGLLSRLLKIRSRFGWVLAVLFLAGMAVSFFAFVKFDGKNPEGVLAYLWPVINLYILTLLVLDYRNYFCGGKDKNYGDIRST